VVGLVVPTGYSFNLDGTNIYLTMAAIFVAQALNIDLTWTQQITLLLVAMLTSKAHRVSPARVHHAGGHACGRAVDSGGRLALILASTLHV
jgi:Na+/H+-dicarboxylate symporter